MELHNNYRAKKDTAFLDNSLELSLILEPLKETILSETNILKLQFVRRKNCKNYENISKI